MPYPDSEYPSVLRGRDKRESQRLLAAAPELLAVCSEIASDLALFQFTDGEYRMPEGQAEVMLCSLRAAIAKAEGRE